MSGIGSVITKDVKPYALIYGNPAKQHGWIDEKGDKLEMIKQKLWKSPTTGSQYKETAKGLVKIS
jgi:UDP-2-acetamido-3-amino-2,3-dideoxy-glucuronate N-acetyltransferase